MTSVRMSPVHVTASASSSDQILSHLKHRKVFMLTFSYSHPSIPTYRFISIVFTDSCF